MYCLNALLIRSFGKIELNGQRKSIPKSLVEASLSNQVLDANPILSGKGVRKQTMSVFRIGLALVSIQQAVEGYSLIEWVDCNIRRRALTCFLEVLPDFPMRSCGIPENGCRSAGD